MWRFCRRDGEGISVEWMEGNGLSCDSGDGQRDG